MRSFPKYDLDNSVEAAKTLHDHGGEASAVQLAAILGYGGVNNGAYLNRIAAARSFGLLQGEGRGATITLTQRARDILQPDYDQTAARARLAAFLAVPLYTDFLAKYEGQMLPPNEGMKNALIGLGVSEKSASMALSRLLSSAEQAGLFATVKDKLIRPPKAAPATGGGSQEGAPEAAVPQPTNVARSKLLDGLIEELPQGRTWTQEGLAEWIDFFERALRIHYALPNPRISHAPK